MGFRPAGFWWRDFVLDYPVYLQTNQSGWVCWYVCMMCVHLMVNYRYATLLFLLNQLLKSESISYFRRFPIILSCHTSYYYNIKIIMCVWAVSIVYGYRTMRKTTSSIIVIVSYSHIITMYVINIFDRYYYVVYALLCIIGTIIVPLYSINIIVTSIIILRMLNIL